MQIVADQNIPQVEQAFAHLGEVIPVDGRRVQPGRLKGADVLIVRSVTRVDRHLLEGSQVQFVGSATIGTDHVDLDYLKQRDIAFASAPGCNATSAAEYVTAAVLDLAEARALALPQLRVGVVGNGNVGSRVVQRLTALGCELNVYDPPRQHRLHDRDYVDWQTICSCDVISAHVPLTRSGAYPTYRMFDAAFFDRLAGGAIFINTARGQAVDEAALKRRVQRDGALSAVLDVWQNEPDIDLELLSATEIATPHIAGYSREGKLRGLEMIYHAACQFFHVEPSWSMQQVLPPLQQVLAPVPETDSRRALNRLVKFVYDIRIDDARLREVQTLPAGQRARHFDELRRNYPQRREFFNYVLRRSEHPTDLVELARALGFTVVD